MGRIQIESTFCAVTLAFLGPAACSSSASKGAVEDAAGVPDSGNAPEVIGSFTVALVSPAVEGGTNPPYTNISGQVYDGPYPELTLANPLPVPPGATPGCAVFGVVSPDCSSIGGCSLGSTNAACAQAATTGVNTCVCVATDTCQRYPSLKNVGVVTVSGVATTTGAKSLTLINANNAYLADPSTLSYPGFGEGDPIVLTASGADYEAFEIEGVGVAPLVLTNSAFHFTRDPNSSDPTQFMPFEITWTPPASADVGTVEVELNISRHAGTIGYLACEVPDTGSLTISSNLIAQLVALGNIAGFPELNVTRATSSSKLISPGLVEQIVESNVEVYPTIDGYTSCLVNLDCPTGQVCNTTLKLCEAG